MKRWILVLLGMFLATLALAQRPGKIATDFTLLDAAGNAVKLSDFRGTPVVMNAWATWCPFCVEELPLFQAANDDLNQDESTVVFLLVNLDEPFEVARRFLVEEVGITVPAVYDGTPEMRAQLDIELDRTKDVLTKTYRVRGMPTTFFIDADGVVQAVQIGPMLSAKQLAGQLSKIGVDWQP